MVVVMELVKRLSFFVFYEYAHEYEYASCEQNTYSTCVCDREPTDKTNASSEQNTYSTFVCVCDRESTEETHAKESKELTAHAYA